MRIQYSLAITLCAFILLIPLSAQIPQTIAYQGLLSDNLGVPKADGDYAFTFRLYDAEVGGNALWDETKELAVVGGLFHTFLGDITDFDGTLLFDQAYWLGIQVGIDPELEPRIPMASVGYSFHAMRADTALHATWADSALNVKNAPAPSGPAGGDLSGAYPDPTIADNVVTSAKINPLGASANQVLTYDGSNVVWLEPPVLAADITGVTAGIGLTGGGPSGDVTLSVDVGTTADKIVQLDGTAKLPAVDGSLLTNLPGGGDITGVTAGTGLTDGGLSGDVTLSVDVGTTADKIVQLDGTGKLPAVDGSLLTNLSGGDGHSLDAADGTPTDAVYIDNDGNVGIGTINPATELDVTGTITASALNVSSTVTADTVKTNGSVEIGGAQIVRVDTTVKGTYTTTTSDRIILCSEGADITLHDAASSPGQIITISNIDTQSSTTTIYTSSPSDPWFQSSEGPGMELYISDGAEFRGITLVSDGAGWYIVSTITIGGYYSY